MTKTRIIKAEPDGTHTRLICEDDGAYTVDPDFETFLAIIKLNQAKIEGCELDVKPLGLTAKAWEEIKSLIQDSPLRAAPPLVKMTVASYEKLGTLPYQAYAGVSSYMMIGHPYSFRLSKSQDGFVPTEEGSLYWKVLLHEGMIYRCALDLATKEIFLSEGFPNKHYMDKSLLTNRSRERAGACRWALDL